MDSVRKHYIKKMPIFDEMTAFNLQSGMNKYFDNYSLKMKAVAYPFAFSSNNRKQLKELIEKSIKNGNPVIISVGPHLWRDVKKDNQAKMYELSKGSLIDFNPVVDTLYNHSSAVEMSSALQSVNSSVTNSACNSGSPPETVTPPFSPK